MARRINNETIKKSYFSRCAPHKAIFINHFINKRSLCTPTFIAFYHQCTTSTVAGLKIHGYRINFCHDHPVEFRSFCRPRSHCTMCYVASRYRWNPKDIRAIHFALDKRRHTERSLESVSFSSGRIRTTSLNVT